MRFIVDAQLPPALAAWIADQGVDAHAVRDIGLRDAPDAAIWDLAVQTSAVIVTKDADFARLAAVSASPPRILWIRLGNTSTQSLLTRMAKDWPQVLAHFADGVVIVELR